MSQPLVIYGVIEDAHIARVATALVARGVEVYVIDPEHQRSVTLDLRAADPRSRLSAVCWRSSQEVPLPETYTYWFRNKKQYNYLRDREIQASQFTIWETTASAIADMRLHGRRSINIYDNFKRHDCKPLQLVLAAQSGLRTPKTMITDSRAELLNFMREEQLKTVANKALANVYIPPHFEDPNDGVTLFTTKIDRDEIEQLPDNALEGPPAIYQEYIDKRFEYRVMMFDAAYVAYRIDSQSTALGKIDWRLGDDEADVERCDLPTPLVEKLDAYLRAAGLNHGAFDLCETPSNEWVFLECNSEGQWAWLESEDREVSDLYARQFQAALD